MKEGKATGKRPYRMRARAEATAATNEKILDAVESAVDEFPIDELTLAKVSERSGVTVQTILRHFGNRKGLITAALVKSAAKMSSDREAAPVGDVKGAVDALVDHYDRIGDRILKLLAAEDRRPAVHAFTDVGRAYHLDWCQRIFAPFLKGLRGAQRERRIAQFVAVTDIYVWKLLRRDRGLSGAQTKLAMCELLEPLVERNR